MKSLTGKFTSVRGWALLLGLLLGAGMFISGCGDEETPAPTTPTPPPAPPPAPEPTPEPTGPATPENLRVTGMTSTSITWSWNAVEGVLGYQGQFSPDATFTAADATFLIVAPATSHTVSNLSGDTTGHFRVRSGTGTSLTDLTFSEWSDGVSGSTAAAPAPAPLAAPTGVEASGPTGTTINVSWDDVDDAGSYEVQRQPADGAWGAASCGGGGGTVTTATCVASGLTRGTSYAFRVRAHPDPDDTTRQVSGWSSTETARTTGTPPAPPVSGGDDAYDITWESNDTSITWTWSRPDDGRIRFLIALVRDKAELNHRPNCPAITVATTDPVPDTESNYNHRSWYGGPDGLAKYSHAVSGLTAGAVRRLCVVPTWKDANGTQQYGTVFSAWAATSPREPDLIQVSNNDPRLGPTDDANLIKQGPKDDSDKDTTTAIDWFVEVDRDFIYEVRTVSAGVDDVAPTCRDDKSGSTNLTSTQDDHVERFRLSSGLRSYTEYKACVRATSDQGSSGWMEFDPYLTLPGKPGTLGTPTTTLSETALTALTWTFGSSAQTPEAPGAYEVRLYHSTVPTSAGEKPVSLTSTCDTQGNGTLVAGGSVRATASGFQIQWSGLSITRQTGTDSIDYDLPVLACVRAGGVGNRDTLGDTDDDYGPWRSATTTVRVPNR